jgi:DNA-binding LytR/AlgR family response regulator
MRTIVVEDERLPRLTLLQKLEELRPQVEVVDSCDNYDDALRSILCLKPDLLLLDIQLQGRDSIQLLEEVKKSITLPYIIFTTAYSDRNYLMSAIKLSAVDYLLKPIDKNSLALAIAKAAERYQQHATAHSPMQAQVPQSPQQPPQSPSQQKTVYRTATGRVFLNPSDIAYIRADGNYSQVTTFNDTENILVSLSGMEQCLDDSSFVRVDRSTIVNSSLIYKLNAKRRICILRSSDGQTVSLELSKAGIDTLLKIL